VGRPPAATTEGGRAVTEATIEAYYLEDRTFRPPEEFRRNALVSTTVSTSKRRRTGKASGPAKRGSS